MANQPPPPSAQPPPDVPASPWTPDVLTNYLRQFSLWCRRGFQAKLDAGVALPGIQLQATDAVAPNPPIFTLGVTSTGVATLTPVALGSGDAGAPVPIASKRGVTDGSNAAAGEIGEYLTASSGTVAVSSNTQTNIISLALTPGDWDLWGNLTLSATAGSTNVQGGITTVSGGGAQDVALVGPSVSAFFTAIVPRRVSITVTTTFYVTGFMIFASGTGSASASLRARRRR
jgi:hypothetical protein